ncbi:CSN8/PSMD8/EIF3K family protein [Aspergillus alliaceus]|uniref:CSN8/PSMD8/EIF3K family protein n=1 Tax=Petromyces alliaceus TaxID=209559 RepID=UPI0012A6BF03|nr:COP9 signalosome [Aspergillus alliaceus]KAB8230199.1 COP9 signalosome [Aspergillus alliaceus]
MGLPPLSKDQLSAVLTSSRSPTELYNTLLEYESEACLKPSNESELLSLFYSTFFFSHLLTDQIESNNVLFNRYEARAMTQRMPQELAQTDPSLQNCLTLLRAVWQRKYESVYKILRELPWPELLRPAVESYKTYFQEKTLKEVSHAYEAIRPAAAANYLGLDAAAAEQGDPAIIQKLTAVGWTWDESTKLLHPKPIHVTPEKDARLYDDVSKIMALVGKYGG